MIEDPNNEVEQGDFAVLAEIYSRVEQVLSIPKSAVHKDAKGAYVYCVVNGESKYTQVKTGKDDGTYIEIIDGLKEGDLVLLSENNLPGDNTAEVKRGDFSSEFEGSAFIAYPISDSVINPVSYGTMYFTEYQVELFQTVKAGDVIAKVHVEMMRQNCWKNNFNFKDRQNEWRMQWKRAKVKICLQADRKQSIS